MSSTKPALEPEKPPGTNDKSKLLGVLRAKTGLKVGLGILVFFSALALVSFVYMPYSPLASTGPDYASPSMAHLFGTTNIGQDVFSEWMFGTRYTLLVGFLTAGISSVIGILVGITSGYIRVLDEPLMRLTDGVLTLPALPLLIVVASFIKPSVYFVSLLISLLAWPAMARVLRSNVLSLRELAFVEVAVLSGVNRFRVMFVDLFKHLLPLVLAYSLFAVIGAILTEASLDFIGVGPVTDYSWGEMISLAQDNNAIFHRAWWWILPPGISITVLATAFGLIAYGLEDYYKTMRMR